MKHAHRWAEPGGNSADRDPTAAEEDIWRTKPSLQSQQRPPPSRPPSSSLSAPDLKAGQQLFHMSPKQFQRSQIRQQPLQTFRHVACIIGACGTKVHTDLLTYLLSGFFIHATLLMSQISTLSV